ncbi:MAG: hypothetical protein AM326_06665 [Candidatus Thorarchaeota archaeon SMTZ-45]|nr:MAG: hypothetical protein AM326_06665 [Candidatus Thorarchaeota archaeon SMTZ-45]
MRKASVILIIMLLPLFSATIITPTITQVDAWGHATHFFIVDKAVAGISNASWADAFDYYLPELMSGSIYPDTAWQDWDNHLYYPETGEHNAPTAAERWYNFTRNNFTIGSWEDGFFAAGIMSHYFSDPCIPVHTGDSWPGHSGYESDINQNLDLLTLATPSEDYITNVSQLVIDSATYSHQYYDDVYLQYVDDNSEAIATNATIKTLTEDCLNLAIDGLLDLFFNATQGVNAPDVTITYEYKAMLDVAHGNDYATGYLDTINSTLYIKGFELILQSAAITTESLAGVDLFIATCASTAYTADELTAITNWANSGNKALLLTGRGDHASSSTNTAYPDALLAAISSNIRNNDDNVYMEGTYNAWTNDLTVIPAPEETVNLTAFVSTMTFFSPSSLYFLDDGPVLPIIYADVTGYQTNQEPPSPTVIYDNVMDGQWGNQIPLAAAEEIGSTRLLVTGTTFFSDYDYGKPQFDNIQLLENFLDWSVGNRSEWSILDVDEVGPRIGDISWDPASPDNGEKVNVSATVTDPSGVVRVYLKYNNGTHDVSLTMTSEGGGLYSGEISDVSSGSLSFYVEAVDNSDNVAIRASFTITWTAPTTTTTTPTDTTTTEAPTTSTTPTETPTAIPPPDDMILVLGIGGAIIVLIVIVVIVKMRR